MVLWGVWLFHGGNWVVEKMDFLSVERDFYEVFVCGVVGVCGLWWFA